MEFIDENVLILGSSAIDKKYYQMLAEEVNTTTIINADGLIVPPASNPTHTKKFVEEHKQDKDFELKLYLRALQCVDKAKFIVVDVSAASTGVGMEVSYLLTKHPEKPIAFIAQEGTKVSPHIAGMYKHIFGKDIEVCYYSSLTNMAEAVRKHSAYSSYYIDLVY